MDHKMQNQYHSNNSEPSPHIQRYLWEYEGLLFHDRKKVIPWEQKKKSQKALIYKEKREGRGEHNPFLIGKELETSTLSTWRGEEKISQTANQK